MKIPEVLARQSFRTKLALGLTTVFVIAGAALVLVEYLMVSQLFDSAIASSSNAISAMAPGVSVVSASRDGVAVTKDVQVMGAASGPALPLDATGTWSTVAIAGQPAQSWYLGQSKSLAGDVRVGLLVWSGVALVVFALLAAGVSWWLARRSMRRIGEVTAMAKDLSTHDLDKRLGLPGPPDEIKELADTFDAMLDRLQASFVRQERFVANASHELRTPLTTARTALEIPLSQGKVPEHLRPALHTALKAGQQSEVLIAALLTLARGRTTGEFSTTDLADVVTDAVDDLRDRMAAATDIAGDGDGNGSDADGDAAGGCGIEIRMHTVPAPVTADQVMLVRAVANLLDNAWLHNEKGGRIWVDVHTEQEMAVLAIENTGQLIDDEHVELLAEPFYRSEANRTSVRRADGRTGVGLGLSIVRSIVEAHHGRLEIAGRPDGGLSIRMLLPVRVPALASSDQ